MKFIRRNFIIQFRIYSKVVTNRLYCLKIIFIHSKGEKMNSILDEKIKLDKETHSYSLINKMDITFTSVTTYIDYFFEKFDAEKVAKKLVAKYPKYENRTVESLLEEWDKSAKYGTIVHDEIENWIKNNVEPKELKSINGKKWLHAYQTKSDIEVMSEIIIFC